IKTFTPVSSFLISSFSKILIYRSIRSGSSIRSSCIMPLTRLYLRINRDSETLLYQDAEKDALLTRPAPARQDAPFPMLRSRIVQTLHVPIQSTGGKVPIRSHVIEASGSSEA